MHIKWGLAAFSRITFYFSSLGITTNMTIPILAVAFGFYIFGISLVLYLKPQVMFGKGGDWKEFGIGRGENRTVIPFWLFCIFWAFISYGVALVIMSQFANIANNSFPDQAPSIQAPAYSYAPQQAPAYQQPVQQPIQTPRPVNEFMKPVSSAFGIPGNMPGYYVLQNTGNAGAPPQYVYYGTEPPKIN
jgi:hypothetical protein